MRIVLLGAPGSGKGTQAAILRDRLNIPHISTGELLRAAVKAGTELGLKAKAVMEAGELVSDEIVLGMLRERLEQDDARGGFILDGYPRNLAQAEALDGLLSELNQPVEEAIQIEVDVEAVVQRLAKRALEEGRSDDTEETVRKRMGVYEEQTAPVVEFYERQEKLARVYGMGTIDEVSERIIEILSGDA
ncbi:MAG: adenylate kinase [Xanthomonadales bacterium]|nr:adenylate kinase [Xanthomonadales bacterium]